MGVEPDLTEGMSNEDVVASQEAKNLSAKGRAQVQQLSSIDEKFNRGLMENPMYKTTSNPDAISHLDFLGKGK